MAHCWLLTVAVFIRIERNTRAFLKSLFLHIWSTGCCCCSFTAHSHMKPEQPQLYFVFPFWTHPLQRILEHLKLQLTDPSLVRSQYQSVKTQVSLSPVLLWSTPLTQESAGVSQHASACPFSPHSKPDLKPSNTPLYCYVHIVITMISEERLISLI